MTRQCNLSYSRRLFYPKFSYVIIKCVTHHAFVALNSQVVTVSINYRSLMCNIEKNSQISLEGVKGKHWMDHCDFSEYSYSYKNKPLLFNKKRYACYMVNSGKEVILVHRGLQ